VTLELLATAIAAIAAAGVAMALRALSRGRLPGWIVPAAAGLGMAAFTIWSEYAWEARAKAGLPPGFVVAAAPDERSVFRPWTWVVPLTTHMLVVDRNQTRRHPAAGELAMTRLVSLGRWRANAERLAVLDCARNARVDVTEGVVFSDAGEMSGGAWTPVAPDDPVLRAACDGG
jgi:hypothetical protein